MTHCSVRPIVKCPYLHQLIILTHVACRQLLAIMNFYEYMGKLHLSRTVVTYFTQVIITCANHQSSTYCILKQQHIKNNAARIIC